MSSLNQVNLIGRLGKEPELRSMTSGDSIANLSLATSERWKDKNGEKQERTEWHRVVLFKKLADIANQYLSKGDLIFVSGSLRTRKWQDKDGADRYSTEIVCQEMKMLQTKGKGNGSRANSAASQQQSPPAQRDDFDSDIPF